MNLLKLFDPKTTLILGLVVIAIYFYKDNQVDNLKNETIVVYKDLTKTNKELKDCDFAISKQNKEIESLKVTVKYTEPKTVEKVKNIYVKDKSCEAELKAYKELFNE